jgi:hypothetical protein
MIPISVLPNMEEEHAGKGVYVITYQDGRVEYTDTPPDFLPKPPPQPLEVYSASVTPTLDQAKLDAKTRVLEWGNKLLGQFTDKYLIGEVQAWPEKRAAAREFLRSGEEAPILTTEARLTGRTVAELAESVVEKGALLDVVSAMAAGLRQNLFNSIDAATDADALPDLLSQAMLDAEQQLVKVLQHG